jgi:hypothetical protein
VRNMPLDLGIDNQLLEVPSVVEGEEHENEDLTEFMSPDWAHSRA